MPTDAEILAAIDADPVLTALVAAGRDGDAALLLPGKFPPEVVPRMLTDRGLFAALGSAAAAESVLDRLQAAAAAPGAPTYLARVLGWLKPSEGGLDMGDPVVRSHLDALATAGVLTAPEVATLKALAEVPVAITAADVSRAIMPRRPGGKV